MWGGLGDTLLPCPGATDLPSPAEQAPVQHSRGQLTWSLGAPLLSEGEWVMPHLSEGFKSKPFKTRKPLGYTLPSTKSPDYIKKIMPNLLTR